MLQEIGKSEEKKKKKLYNPFANDQDYYTVDENLPIEIKSKIPHWVPTKNSDMFEVRKVLAIEKEHIRNLNRSIGVYKLKNEFLISKKILEEESKKLNKKVNRDVSQQIIVEEKIKNKNNRNYITENRYNEMNKININKIKVKSSVNKNEKNILQTELSGSDGNSKLNKSGEFSQKALKTDNNSIKSMNYNRIEKNYDHSPENNNHFNKNRINTVVADASKLNKNLEKIKENFNEDSVEIQSSSNKNNRYDDKKILIKEKSKNLKNNNEKKNREKNDNYNTNKANTSILITSLAHESSAKIDDYFRKENNKELKKKFDTSILHELKEENEKLQNEENENNKKDNTKSNKLAKSENFEPPITSKLRYSVREYINKTREVVLLRHSVEIKKDTALRMEEDYKNQIESVRESIVSLQQAKQLFEDDFIVRFEKYVKYLRIQREKEINELNNILEEKSRLELEVQKLETRRHKTRGFLNLYREYRDFLICVKERTINLPKFFTENENYRNNIVNEFGKSKNTKYSRHNSTFSNNNFQVNNGNYSEIDSDLEDEEKMKILIEREKLQRARNFLLNQLQGTSSNNNTISNKNSSPANKNSKNVNNTLTSINNVKKNSNNNNTGNSNSKENTYTNSISKNNLNKKMNNKLTNSKTIQPNASVNQFSANTILNNNNNNAFLHSNTYLDNTLSSGIKIKNSTLKENDPTLAGVSQAELDKFNNYISKPIYETPDDLNEDIKKMQLENINLLKKLTSTASKANIIKQELQKMIKEDKNETALLLIEVEIREENLKKVQDITKGLIEEKNMLIGNTNGNYGRFGNVNANEISSLKKINLKKSLIKSKFNQAILYSKVNELFNVIIEMPINVKEKKDFNANFNNNNANMNSSVMSNISVIANSTKRLMQLDKESNLMYMLKIIEKSIDYLVTKQNNYLKDPKKSLLLDKYKSDLDKERKITKAVETRLKDEKRREIVSVAIIERNSRPIVLPKKRFGEKAKPVEKQVKTLYENKNKEETSMHDLIIY